MAITLTVAGTKTKFDNAKVEAAFTEAVAEFVNRGDVLVSLASAAVSKIAATHGLIEVVEEENSGGGLTRRNCCSIVILERVASILGCDDLSGNFRTSPALAVQHEQEIEALRADQNERSKAWSDRELNAQMAERRRPWGQSAAPREFEALVALERSAS